LISFSTFPFFVVIGLRQSWGRFDEDLYQPIDDEAERVLFF
jgi:hypothetical protein